jgi:hypothetical protein
MADKLLIEVEMLNERADDAVFALLYLANSLAESPTIHIKNEHEWEEHIYDSYRLKWRFADEAQSAPRPLFQNYSRE